MTRQPLIELHNVSVSYNGNVHAIEGVTLNVEEGELLGLLGPNGGGKTTLIKVILGLTGSCCGTVTVLGERLCHSEKHGPIRPPTRHSSIIGYLPQDVLSQAKGFPATVREVVS
ncbi:MAG: ATP-binding cassette domain-containing protein, partial [Candidatus Bathyarchaeia archaeon]